MNELPVVDLAPWLTTPSSDAGRAAALALTTACHEVGFVHLVGHGVDAGLEGRVHELARQFFALPEPDRLEIANTNTPYFRGYTRLGMEHTNGVSDWRDQIDIGPEHEPVDVGPDEPAWLRLRGPNQWPSALPELQPVVTAWMAQMARVGRAALGALAVGLGQLPDHFDSVVEPDPEVLVKVIRYPGRSAGADGGGQGVGAHHDSGLLSFILQDEVGGLEVQVGDGFVPVAPHPGAYVMNLGEMLQLATHGYLRATRHRVVSPPEGSERISVAYFFNPRMEATLQPVDLSAELMARAPGGQNANPHDPVFSTYGDNWVKFRIRSHPDVAERHHADLVAAFAQERQAAQTP
jgi:isopenicillin N synthase-like dioxygenase